MAIYDIYGNALTAVYDKNGNSLSQAYDINGNVIFQSGDIPSTLNSYSIFVPEDVSDEWNTGAVRGKTLNVLTSDFLALFYDGFVSDPPNGMTVTKTSIGKDETNQYDMFEYDFCPRNYTRTILLSSGMHTYELSASFGLANFITNLYSSANNVNTAFQYIRKYVRIKVIPIVNPWGFNQSPKVYGNANGINPNRNFDYDSRWDDFTVYIPSQNEWNVKGEHPFSEKEVINLANWVNDNWTAEYWIDCHTDVGNINYDLDIYSLSGSAIATPINNAISKIEDWFEETYGSTCVTKHLLDNSGSIRQFWGEYVMGMATFTPEQSTARTTFGTSYNNDSGDISNYSTNISTYVQELLLSTYVDNTVIPIASASNPSAVSIDVSTGSYSATIESTISPANTTQNKFVWATSDESVCKVYGGTNKAIVIGVGNGTATLTGTNRYDASIVITCSVTVTGYVLANAISLNATIGSIAYIDGSDTSATNRVRTDYIDISDRTWTSALTFRDMDLTGVGNEFLIRLYDSNHEFITTLSSSYWSGNKDGSWSVGNGTLYNTDILPSVAYIRLVFRNADDSDITSASGSFRIRNTTYTFNL